MPSFGGPPDMISSNSIDDREKSVFFHSCVQELGGSAAGALANGETQRKIAAKTNGRNFIAFSFD